MKAKLIKLTGIYTLIDGDKMIASSDEDFQKDYEIGKLSLSNCLQIEFGYSTEDIEKLFEEVPHTVQNKEYYWQARAGYLTGFLKALELMADKKFTEDDLDLQPIEWNVEVVTERFLNGIKIDGGGCLILKPVK